MDTEQLVKVVFLLVMVLLFLFLIISAFAYRKALKENKNSRTLRRVTNRDPQPNESEDYYIAIIDGDKYVFTPHQIKIARERAEKNLEDFTDY
jgi:hypothetical protein